jgi:uncharacterized protein YlzI (FlbEa/FlbD family)
MTMLLGGTSLVLLWRISTTNRDVFSFLKLWPLYPATLGQAIPSAFGQLGLALTLWDKRIRENYSGGYVLKLIGICETITVTYNSIINGSHLNDVMLNQIDCLADYIYTVQENKESIIKKSVEEVKRLYLAYDETKLQEEISTDIDRFYTLVTNVIRKHAVFGFSKENLANFEKI